jgi:hypothetical protein
MTSPRQPPYMIPHKNGRSLFLNIKVVVQHAVTHVIGLYKHVWPVFAANNLIEATLQTQITPRPTGPIQITISLSCLTFILPMAMVPLMLILDVLVIVSSLAAFLAIRDYQIRGGLPYPPGPRPLPLIGNLIDIPKEFSWLTYTQLSKKYGMSRSLL